MGDINFLGIFDVILLGFGVYMIIAAIRMKNSGNISNLLMNDTEAQKISDKKGFIAALYPRMLVFAIVTMTYGAVALLDDFGVVEIPFVQIIGIAGFIVAMVWFFMGLVKARNRY